MPLKDEALNPIDETNYQQNVTPNLSVEIGDISPLAFRFNAPQSTIPNPEPLSLQEKPNAKDAPGFFKSFGHATWEYNELVNAGKFISQSVETATHLNDYIPDNWRSDTLESIQGYSEKYWPYIWDAISPADQSLRQQQVQALMKDDEFYADGSFLGNLSGAIVGGLSSPSTWLIPAAAGIKYAKFGENIIKNTWNAMPSVALSVIATDGMYEAGHAGGNMQDWAINSLRDTVFATALIGGAKGLGSAFRGGELYALKKTTNFAAKGVDFVPEIEDGIYKGIKAKPNSGFNVSAQLVNEAQLFADSTMNKSGAFKYVPYLDAIAGNKILGSPIVKGLTSGYLTTRGFIDRIAAHGIETLQISKGIARPMSAEEHLGRYRAEATMLGSQLKGLYYEANGLSRKDNVFNALKNVKQTLSENKTITIDDFGKGIRSVLNTNEPHATAQVNEGAKYINDFLQRIGDEFAEVNGFESFLSPRTQANYIMQNYHLGNVRVRDRAFYDIVTDGLTKQFERIKELNAPIEAAEQKVRNLQEAMLSKNLESETKSIAYEIESAKKFLNEERQKLINHLLDNEDDHILLEDRVLLNQQEQAELKSILEQKENIELEISKNQKILTGLKEKKSKIKQNIQKAKKDITREKHLNTLEELEKSIEFQASSLNAWKDKLIDEEERLTADAKAGLINRKYFFTEADSQRVKFKDPNATPKFRYVPESIEERRATAQHLRDTILGNTATHLNNTVLGNMFSNVVEKPTSTKARTVMLPAELFNEAGFLDNDLSKAISSYANAMGRHIALKRAFGNTLTKPGIEGILDALLKEKQEKNLELMDKYKDVAETDKKRIKAINKHEKEYQREVDFIKDVYNAYMGNIGNPKVRRITQSFKNHAAATLLGGVPLSQITDLGAIVLKHGLFPFMMEGLLPALKTLNGKMKGKDAEAIRENASHALVAIQNIASGAQDKFINDAMTDVPMYGRIGSFLDTAAHVSGNIYGTNHIENLNQTIVANMTQSKIMKAAFDVKNGTASEATIRKMAHIGIDIKKDAERFIAQYEQHGGWKQAQGYQSQYYNWSDVEAANTVSEAIYRSVYDTVVQRGMFSSPLWTNDPILGMIFTFHGWAYSAFTRYTIPALQRPDAQAAMGVATMFGLGLLIEPLRQYANGKEVKLSNNHMFLKALDNSGVLSAGSDMFNTLNLLMGKKLVPGMASERRKEVSVLGALAGPVGGNFEQGMALLQHLWTGKITQNDAKTGARLLGLNSHLLLRKHIDNFFKNTGLPEKSKDAEPWGWYSTLEDTLED